MDRFSVKMEKPNADFLPSEKELNEYPIDIILHRFFIRNEACGRNIDQYRVEQRGFMHQRFNDPIILWKFVHAASK